MVRTAWMMLAVCLCVTPTAWSQTSDDAVLDDVLRRVDALESGRSSLRSKLGFDLTLYGFLRIDAVYDDSEFNDTQVASRVLPEGGPNGVRPNNHDFSLYPRLTRIGLDVNAGTVADAKLTGKLEVDFYAFNSSDSRDMFRLRKAYLQIAKGDFSFLAGQEYDVISPLYPSVNPDLLNWLVGNTGDRRPQLRATYSPALGDDTKIILSGALGLQGAIDNKNTDVDGVTDGENSGKPMLQGRAAVRTKLGEKHAEIGIWGARGWEQVDNDGAGEFDMVLYGLDLTVPIGRNFSIKGELWQGKNLSDVRGGVGQGIALGKEVSAQGGWVQATQSFAGYGDVFAGYTFDDPDSNDVPLVTGVTNNSGVYVGTTLKKYSPLVIGLDGMHWRTRYHGNENGSANRARLYFMLLF